MELKSLLTDVELNVRELKYLTTSFLALTDDEELKELLQHKIVTTQAKLQEMLLRIDDVKSIDAEEGFLPADDASQPEVVAIVQEVVVAQVEPVPIELNETKSVDEVQQSLATSILGEQFRSPSDLRQSISLNDSFRFSRELFNSDSELMNQVLEQVSCMSSYDGATAYLSAKLKLDEEDETVADLLELLKRYFNK